MPRRERKKRATRDAIFNVAQKLFMEKGFENTSVEEITEQVDIAQSTFFNYFPRKEDILLEIFQRKLPYLKKKCQAILQSDELIKAKIHAIFSATASIAARNENITRAVMINNFSNLSSKNYDRVFFDGFRNALSLVLEKGQEEGHVRQDVSAIRLATMLEGVFTLFIIDCLLNRTHRLSSGELFDRLDICLEGMIATSRRRRGVGQSR